MPFVENFEITLSDNGRALWTFELDDVLASHLGHSPKIDAWLRSESVGKFFFDESTNRVSAQFDGIGIDGRDATIEFGSFSTQVRHLADQAQSFFLCPMKNGEMLAAFEMPALAFMHVRELVSAPIASLIAPSGPAPRKFNAGGSR